MIPLFVQLVAWAAFWAAGLAGLAPGAASAPGALRFALAAMFIFTAISHFAPRTRNDLIRMVPPVLPARGAVVTLTGILELAGAIGLLIPSLVRPAAFGLTALLAALFPANVHATRTGVEVAGRPTLPLPLRSLLQLFWVGCLLWVLATAPAP